MTITKAYTKQLLEKDNKPNEDKDHNKKKMFVCCVLVGKTNVRNILLRHTIVQ